MNRIILNYDLSEDRGPISIRALEIQAMHSAAAFGHSISGTTILVKDGIMFNVLGKVETHIEHWKVALEC